ncbi:MAG: hypothetical protein V7K41_25290 [Nostoc sp.]|uniref:hypothetical protein n=1 Tax=Nostoc sp. TaxID=1180 RepID=UPI002FF62D84
MKVLLNECLPKKLKREITGHAVFSNTGHDYCWIAERKDAIALLLINQRQCKKFLKSVL